MPGGPAIDRRSLLAGAGAAAAAAAAGAAPARGAAASRRGRERIPRVRISIQLYTLRALPLEAQLAGAARIGFETVEHVGLGDRTAAQFKAALRRHGLRATSGHQAVPQPWDERAWRRQVADAVTIGQRFIVTSSGPAVAATRAAWQAYAADLNRAGRIARRAGLRLGFHNHSQEFSGLQGSPLCGFDVLLEETDPRLVHFELDLYWAWHAHRDPRHLIAYAGERIRQFHVKDMRYVDGAPTFADAGTGVIGFAAILAAAGRPREHEYIVERDDAGVDALRTARAGFDYLNKVRL